MKPRRVIVTLELTTDVKLSELKRAAWWNDQLYTLGAEATCEQAQANVVKVKPRRKR